MSDEQQVEPVFDIDTAAITDPIYKALAARFSPMEHGTLPKAGGQTYVPWNLIANRLNIVLGVEKWSFRILREGFTASECWVLGELTATIRDTPTVRQQYGLAPMTTDDLLKKAGTDAFKKCAQVLGVALYLTDADERAEVKAEMAAARRGQPVGNARQGDDSGPRPIRSSGAGDSSTGATANDLESFSCEECGESLTETRFKDGTNWAPSQLAVFGRRKHSRILCMSHYREANQAKRRAEEALQQVPF